MLFKNQDASIEKTIKVTLYISIASITYHVHVVVNSFYQHKTKGNSMNFSVQHTILFQVHFFQQVYIQQNVECRLIII